MEPSKLNSGLDVLAEAECMRLIRTESVGRLGVVVAGRPLIYPVNFVLAGETILVRTDDGTMHEAALNGPIVFEVDHLDPTTRFGWSVMVHGSAHLSGEREGRPGSQSGVLRPWLQAVLPHLLRIVPRSVTGRRVTGPPVPIQQG